MIVSANESTDYVSAILRLSESDPFACRIISLCNSYTPDLVFVDYWLVVNDETEKATGAIARSGSNFILFLTDETDLDEVSSFMRIAGASGAICSGKYQLDLPLCQSVTGTVLVKDKPFELIDHTVSVIEPDIQSAYNLIVKCADENFNPPPFDDFYVDINHKLRHGAMRIYGITDHENLVSVAMTVAESNNGAVLGAVSCNPEYRRHGYGSAIVKYITNRLIAENKRVYLHRAENANVAFYHNLGFTECGTWREYYFER